MTKVLTWYEMRCASCLAVNFVYDGDTSDLSGVDVDGFVCWECNTNNEISDDGHIVLSQEDQLTIGERIPSSAELEP